MHQYKKLVRQILNKGTSKGDRTGTGTLSIFGHQMRFDLTQGFPAVTTKKLAWRAVVSELLWFLEGSGDERRLAEILHGTRDSDKKTIWTDNANADYWKNGGFDGDLGRVYGVQWRNWLGYDIVEEGTIDTYKAVVAKEFFVDQLQNLIDTLISDPNDRRMIISSHNVAEMVNGKMALPPCHNFAQFWTRVNEDGELVLSCHMYQRSVDTFLGLPFNIASYALLTYIIADIVGMGVDEFIWSGGDCHIYSNHIEQCKEVLRRRSKKLPTLKIERKGGYSLGMVDTYLSSLDVDSFILEDYKHHKPIKAKMAV